MHLLSFLPKTRFRFFTRSMGLFITALVLLCTMVPADLWAQKTLPIPRFVSLRASEVNLRTGPGVRYPVEWIYIRKGVPVEVIAEFENWRKVRDWRDTVGWVHRSMLSGKRTLVIAGDRRTLRADPSLQADVVSLVDPGVFGHLQKCEEGWCLIEIGDESGWLRRFEFWGVYPQETVE